MKTLLTGSPAYKVIAADKKSNTLSHAYLVVCSDEGMIGRYLTELAKLLSCENADYCDNCRICSLVSAHSHPDVFFYPKDGKKLSVADADEIIEESVVKPLELKEKIFVVEKVEDFGQYQNKLLKTVEEPPRNVRLILGTTREAAVLPTIKSRVKTLSIPDFSDEELMRAAKKDCPDEQKLSVAVSLAGGKLGEVYRYYGDDTVVTYLTVCDMIMNMRRASDVLGYASRLKDVPQKDLLSITKACFACVQRAASGGEKLKKELSGAEKIYSPGMLFDIIDRISGIEKTVNFNGNKVMVVDSLLFAVMEEKAKWQRLSV